MSLSGRVHAEAGAQADRAPVTIRLCGLESSGALAASDRNQPAPVPRASVSGMLTASCVGFSPMTRTVGLSRVRPPPVIVTVAVDALPRLKRSSRRPQPTTAEGKDRKTHGIAAGAGTLLRLSLSGKRPPGNREIEFARPNVSKRCKATRRRERSRVLVTLVGPPAS
jgi:hypothetical protein